MAEKMTGAVLPGNSTVDLREFSVPEPGTGQVLLAMKASTVCGSDIRAIYRGHEGHGAEGYQGVICGHEPCGQVVKLGPGCRRFREGARVIVYHISGCGTCPDCRRGYQISCSGAGRAAYGWQRDGGNADYLLAEERDLVVLPDELSYIDGAQVACGFGTCYEALSRMGVSGRDTVLVVGLGPVGLAALMLARAMGAPKTIGVEIVPERIELARQLNLADLVVPYGDKALDEIKDATGGHGAEAAVDCSGDPGGRFLAIRATRAWGRMAFVGEGGDVAFQPSRDVMHKHLTLYGSWVTSLGNMEKLVEDLVRWKIRPEALVTDRFPLADVSKAYRLMDEGRCGKVAVTW